MSDKLKAKIRIKIRGHKTSFLKRCLISLDEYHALFSLYLPGEPPPHPPIPFAIHWPAGTQNLTLNTFVLQHFIRNVGGEKKSIFDFLTTAPTYTILSLDVEFFK